MRFKKIWLLTISRYVSNVWIIKQKFQSQCIWERKPRVFEVNIMFYSIAVNFELIRSTGGVPPMPFALQWVGMILDARLVWSPRWRQSMEWRPLQSHEGQMRRVGRRLWLWFLTNWILIVMSSRILTSLKKIQQNPTCVFLSIVHFSGNVPEPRWTMLPSSFNWCSSLKIILRFSLAASSESPLRGQSKPII